MIRTCDPLVPSEVRYQAALHPVMAFVPFHTKIKKIIRQVSICIYKFNIWTMRVCLCYNITVMVRLINKNNISAFANVAYRILKIQEKMTYIRNWNCPDLSQCIYAMWHEHQFSVHGLPNRNNTNILISTSLDGDIVALVAEKWGFNVVRGSAGRKRAVASAMELKDALKKGESLSIMVDGPRGPYHAVKRGAVVLSKESGVPVVPLYWYSEDKTFVKLPSWDKMSVPAGPCRILNIYGDPIYPEGKSEEEISDAIKDSLLHLENNARDIYQEARKKKLWSQKQ